MKGFFAKVAMFFMILLMSGVVKDSVDPETPTSMRPRWVVVASIYFLGVYGLLSMYQAKSWVVLAVGFMAVLIAYFSLEILLRSI